MAKDQACMKLLMPHAKQGVASKGSNCCDVSYHTPAGVQAQRKFAEVMGLEMKEVELKAHINHGKGKSRLGGGTLQRADARTHRLASMPMPLLSSSPLEHQQMLLSEMIPDSSVLIGKASLHNHPGQFAWQVRASAIGMPCRAPELQFTFLVSDQLPGPA